MTSLAPKVHTEGSDHSYSTPPSLGPTGCVITQQCGIEALGEGNRRCLTSVENLSERRIGCHLLHLEPACGGDFCGSDEADAGDNNLLVDH